MMAVLTWLSLLAALYIVLFMFKSYFPNKAEHLYQTVGLDIGLFQVKFTCSAKGRWITSIPTTRKCKVFYKYGMFFTCLLIIPALLFLLVNLLKVSTLIYTALMGTAKHNVPLNTEELVFQPVIPGVTFPMSEVGFYAISLLLSTIYHEFGHALAADCLDVKLLGYGVLVIFLIPAAYVDLSTAELSSLAPNDQLKVYTGGVWHNVMLSSIAYVLIISYPYLLAPIYLQNEGLFVTNLKNSSVTGPSGLEIGDLLISVNGCPVRSVQDFHFCLQNYAQTGYCFNGQDLEKLACTQCCEEKNSSYLNFQNNHDTSQYCLHVRTAVNTSATFCQSHCDDSSQKCLVPQLTFPHESLFHIKRKNQRDFLFIGYSSDLLTGITSMTDFVPKYAFMPITLPIVLEKLLYYTCSFSLALGLINIVPCLMLDGQFVAKTLLRLFVQNESTMDCISKYLIWTGTSLLMANIILTFFAMKFM